MNTLCMAVDRHQGRAALRAARGRTSAAARPDPPSLTAAVQRQCMRRRPLSGLFPTCLASSMSVGGRGAQRAC